MKRGLPLVQYDSSSDDTDLEDGEVTGCNSRLHCEVSPPPKKRSVVLLLNGLLSDRFSLVNYQPSHLL